MRHTLFAFVLSKLPLGAVVAAGLIGCTSQNPAMVDPGGPAGGTGALTYHQDIAPIIAQRCVACHQPGGIGPFPLQTYDQVKQHAGLIALDVQNRKMPPLPPREEGCQPLDDFRDISDDDRMKLVDWANGDALEGDPATAAPMPVVASELGAPSLTFDSGVDYAQPDGVTDEYRCFVVDPGMTATLPLIAAGTSSTNNAIVHHVIVYAQLPAQKAEVDALDAADAGPGYECFGGPSFTNAISVAASAVGSLPRPFPAGSGVPLPAGTRFVVQFHYNYVNGAGSNRFQLQLWGATQPLTQIPHGMVVGNTTFYIPAGAPDVEASAVGQIMAQPPQGVMATKPGLLWSVFPHMHQLGRSIYLEVQHTDGSKQCLMSLPQTWDFHWQGSYQFATPVQLVAGDLVKLTCTWDNSAANQPYVGGTQQPPHDVRFGEKTTDEMCLAGLLLTN